MRSLLFLTMAATTLTTASAVAQPRSTDENALRVLPVQGNVYMIVGAGPNNVPVQISSEGAVLVNTPPPEQLPQLLDAISEMTMRPNAALVALIHTTAVTSYTSGDQALMATSARPILEYLHTSLYNRLQDESPADLSSGQNLYAYYTPKIDFGSGEAIVIHHVPEAITDSDSIVLFRGSDVIVTGPIYTHGRYPVIDVARGGSIQGLIDALNLVLDLAVPGNFASGGTLIIPGQGRISSESDVGEYRNMVVIIKDRIQSLMNEGRTLEQIQAAQPTLGYDGEHHATPADARAFVEAIYLSLEGD